MRVKLNQPIQLDGGEITTCAALLDTGRALVRRVDHFGKNDVTKYFCDLIDADGAPTLDGWEIGQKAYESRAAKGQDKPTPRADGPLQLDDGAELALSIDAAWDGDSFVADVPLNTLVQMRAVYDVFHSESLDVAGCNWRVWFNERDIPIKRVYIPTCDAHEGFYGRYVHLYWQCPTCGAPRGDIHGVLSYDGSRRLHCDGWSNPCGHVDKYADVRAEAADNGLNA